jgi:DNA polymerase kappa
MNWNIN